MGEGWVVFAYLVTYGAITAYAVSLFMRKRRLLPRRR